MRRAEGTQKGAPHRPEETAKSSRNGWGALSVSKGSVASHFHRSAAVWSGSASNKPRTGCDDVMANKGKVEHNERKAREIARLAERRTALRASANNLELSEEERFDARRKLEKLPRWSHPTRHRNRCSLTGRPRAFYRKFGICRHKLRELAHRGEIPGMKKASW